MLLYCDEHDLMQCNTWSGNGKFSSSTLRRQCLQKYSFHSWAILLNMDDNTSTVALMLVQFWGSALHIIHIGSPKRKPKKKVLCVTVNPCSISVSHVTLKSVTFLARLKQLSFQATACCVASCTTVKRPSHGSECGASSLRKKHWCSTCMEPRR